MIALNFLFWCLVVGVVAATAIPFIILFLVGIWKRSSSMKWIGGIPAAFILIGAFTLFCFLMYGFIHPWSETTSPQDIRDSFTYNFDQEPSTDFSPLNQKTFCLADTGCMYLKFSISPATFDKVIAPKFNSSSIMAFTSATEEGANVPAWWVKPESLNNECFENEKWKGSFASNRAYLFYDRASGIVYFYSVGID